MRLRYTCQNEQNTGGDHAYEDRGGRWGGTLVGQDGTPFSKLPIADRKAAEAQGHTYYELSPRGCLFYVIDGVGGAPLGGRAADMVQAGLNRFTAADPAVATTQDVLDLLEQLNVEVRALGLTPDGRSLGAVALTLLWCAPPDKAVLFHVGDTVAWHLSQGSSRLRQATADHGVGKVLHRYLGQGPGFAVDVVSVFPQGEDLLVLCSDGVTKGLRISAAERLIAKQMDARTVDLAATARDLIRAARRGGSTDDITVVVVEINEDA